MEYSVSRLVAEHFIEKPDPYQYYEVEHIDGNTLNNNYKNLRWRKINKRILY